MTRFVKSAVTVLVCIFLVSLAHLAPASSDPPDPDRTPEACKDGEILVKFKAGVSVEKKSGLHARNGSAVIKEFRYLRLQHVKLKKGLGVAEAIRRYQNDPDVEYAQPNYRSFMHAAPNDPRFASQWDLRNTGQTGGTPGAPDRPARAP